MCWACWGLGRRVRNFIPARKDLFLVLYVQFRKCLRTTVHPLYIVEPAHRLKRPDHRILHLCCRLLGKCATKIPCRFSTCRSTLCQGCSSTSCSAACSATTRLPRHGPILNGSVSGAGTLSLQAYGQPQLQPRFGPDGQESIAHPPSHPQPGRSTL